MMKLKTITLDDLGIYLPARNRLSQLQTEFPENIPSIGSPSQGKVNLQKSVAENILVQNLLTDFLCFQAGTDFYLPSKLPETFYNSFYHLLHLARLADDGKNQKLRYSTPSCYLLFAFFDDLREDKIYPLFVESCKTYAALGKACIDHQQYRLVETDETPEPDLSDPLIRLVHDLPSGTPVNISVYLPVKKAIDNPTIQQMTALCGTFILATGICGGVDCVTGLLGERK